MESENEGDLRKKMMRLEKLKRSELLNEKCEVKDYVRKLSAHDAEKNIHDKICEDELYV